MKAMNEFSTNSKTPKQVRYGWVSKNAPGEMRYVSKHDLIVPVEYQRKLNDNKRKRIAGSFNWAAFGVLLVAKRKNGDLMVMDGQHRLAAACSRTDITDVPIIVFELAGSVPEEAADFLIANKDRKPLTGLDSFQAMVVAGERAAVLVQGLIELSGRTIGKNPTQVQCVGTLVNFAKSDYKSLENAWPTIVDLCKDDKFDNRLVQAIVVLEQKIHDTNGKKRSISEPKIHQKVIEIGFMDAMKTLHQAAAVYQYGGSRVWAKAILGRVNRGLRNKFIFGAVESLDTD